MLYFYFFFLDLQTIVAGRENIKNEQLLICNKMHNFNSKFDRNIFTRENSTDNHMHWLEQYEIELPLKTVKKYEQL